jgi:hypothetical protein
MREALRTVATLSSALAARRYLVLEYLALRHQLGVLARSDRRFRPSDRLFWLCLHRGWPRWKDALVLVQPATVDRWHRKGFRRCWRRRSRRLGRPRLDSGLRAIIRRMSAENFLWGAPRIHGELLKLGFTVSERTVSRYLPNRLRASSQTWQTFLANHVGDRVPSSTLTSSDAVSGDGGDGDVVSFGCAPSSGDALSASNQWAVTRWSLSFEHSAPTYLRRRTRPGSSKDPPPLFRRRDGPQHGRASGYSVTRAHQEAGQDSFGGTGSPPVLDFSAYICNLVVNGMRWRAAARETPVSERLSRRSEYWRGTAVIGTRLRR